MKIFYRGLILSALPLCMELLFIGSLTFVLQKSEAERATEQIYRRGASLQAREFGHMCMAPYLLSLKIYTKSDKVSILFHKEIQDIIDGAWEIREFGNKYPIVPKKDVDHELEVINLQRRVLLDTDRDCNAPGVSSGDGLDLLTESMEKLQTVVSKDLANAFIEGDRQTVEYQQRLEETRKLLFSVLAVGVFANLALAVALAIFYRQTILERIKVIAKNTEALSGKAWLIPEMGGNDEIASLDSAFHSMYKRLLKAAELEKALFLNASDLICVLDGGNHFLRINPAGRRNWGLSIDELELRPLQQIVLPEDYPKVIANIQTVKASGGAVSFEAGIKTGTGEKRFGLWSMYWSADVQNLFFIFHDITERRLIEQERKNFLSMISSDLQKPLAKISSSVATLGHTSLEGFPQLAREKLLPLERNIKRLLALVKELIQVTEMESGNLQLNCTLCSVDELFDHAASEVQALLQARRIQLNVVRSTLQVYADSDKIMQVLVNLLSNAIKFSAENSSVNISAEKADSSNRFVKLSVQDFGRGIPASQKESVFQKFKQVELADAKRKAGTGLGLPICKQIVEQHGGHIDLESTTGKGSTFFFTLPTSQAATVSSFVPTDAAFGAVEIDKKQKNANDKNGANTQVSAGVKKPLRFPLAWQGAVLVGLPLLFELVFVSGLYNSLAQVQAQRVEELKMRNICYNSSRGLRLINEVAMSLMHNNQAHHDIFDKNQAEWDKLYEELSASIAKDPSFAEVREKIDGANVRLTNTRKLLKTTGSQTANAMALLGSLMTINKNLTAINVIAEEHEHLDPAKEHEHLAHQYRLLVGGLVLNALLSLLLCLYFSFGFSRRLVVMADNTKRLANEEELNPLIGGNDEITDLDEAFHKVSTGLLESRRRERAVFDNCKDVLCVLSKDGKFLSFNPAVESEWAVKRSDMQESNVSALVLPDDLPAITKVISGPTDRQIEESLELKVKTGDGRVIWTLWTISRGKGQSSSFCVVRDQTDQKQLQQLRKEFLAVVSHDLRTPLTAIMGLSTLVAENCFGPVEGTARVHIELVQRSCEMLLELINDILDLEKFEAGQMRLDLRPHELKTLIDSLISQCKSLPCQIQLRSAGEKFDEPFLCDSERLIQSLSNLVKYMSYRNMSQSPQLIRILAAHYAQGVEIQIFDNGPPIPEALHQRLFERLKDASMQETFSESTFRAELALPLAAKIITSHQGAIEMLPQANGTNSFRIRLPHLKNT